jgi:hypothetical protein
MIRKLFIISLLVIAIPAICFAAADQSRAAAVGGKVDQIVAIGDASSGYLVEVNSNTGAMHTVPSAQAVGVAAWSDTLIYTGACRIISISIAGASAGDYAMIYDAVTATGTPKFDPRIAVNTSSLTYYIGGAPFATGIYVDVQDTEVFVSVVYDY